MSWSESLQNLKNVDLFSTNDRSESFVLILYVFTIYAIYISEINILVVNFSDRKSVSYKKCINLSNRPNNANLLHFHEKIQSVKKHTGVYIYKLTSGTSIFLCFIYPIISKVWKNRMYYTWEPLFIQIHSSIYCFIVVFIRWNLPIRYT